MSKPTITPTTDTTVTAAPGEVLTFGVKVTGSRKSLAIYAEGIDCPLRLVDGDDGEQRAYLAAQPGTTRVTASLEGATPIEFTITTTQAAGELAADTEKE